MHVTRLVSHMHKVDDIYSADHLVEDAGFKLTTPSSNKEAWFVRLPHVAALHSIMAVMIV